MFARALVSGGVVVEESDDAAWQRCQSVETSEVNSALPEVDFFAGVFIAG